MESVPTAFQSTEEMILEAEGFHRRRVQEIPPVQNQWACFRGWPVGTGTLFFYTTSLEVRDWVAVLRSAPSIALSSASPVVAAGQTHPKLSRDQRSGLPSIRLAARGDGALDFARRQRA